MSSRRQYPFHLIEPKWQQHWDTQQTFKAWNPGEVLPAAHPFAVRHSLSGPVAVTQLPPKYYILDMFPYPSGAGLHVGHPEGYTATDILARYKRARGFNVLHPMGWDAFGLPAEQYAIKTGQHPRKTTEANVTTFKRQIQSLGFSYDWSREVDTTDPGYFKWTQWIFLQLYNAWFNPETNKAEPISTLKYPADCTTEEQKRAYRDSKRLAYVSEAPVNWCPELGTVLANEEVIDGKSEVGGFPVIRKPMRQWMLRITAYAEKLLNDLDGIDWSHSLKEMQRNWIGRSEGAEVDFEIADCGLRIAESGKRIRVFTTRPDTLFGATYMVLAPEHKLIDQILALATIKPHVNGEITAKTVNIVDASGKSVGIKPLAEAIEVARSQSLDLIQLSSVGEMAVCLLQDFGAFRFAQQELAKHGTDIIRYREEVAKKSDLERTELAKEKTGVFTGAYAINPVNGEKIPIWIADYVLATYGTGAIMAVPAHDERDWEFAKKFNLPTPPVVASPQMEAFKIDDRITRGWREVADPISRERIGYTLDGAPFVEEGVAVNSANSEISLNGLPTAEAKAKITSWLEAKGVGKKTINYKLRDWLFSRQRYWGEPFPIVWKDGHHSAVAAESLPLQPPDLTDFKPTSTGEPPLARAKDWVSLVDGSVRETNTMPQWAGSCWYYLRYLDARNGNAFCGKEAESYWMGTGGGKLKVEGSRLDTAAAQPATCNLQPVTPGVDLYVGGTEHAVLHLLYARFWHKVLFDLGHVSTPEPFFKLVNQGLILGEDGQKMSKSRGNVVNPDDILSEYGADAFRLYEMFMGPLEMVKPWNTKGVEGVYRFLGRVWRMFINDASETEFEQAETTADASKRGELLKLIQLDAAIKDVEATPAQLKTLHTAIKKVTEDLDAMRFNTAISALMVFTNEAMTWETKPVSVLRSFLQLLAPFAPHIAEELWDKLNGGRATSLVYAPWPAFDPALLVEDTLEIPVQVNGKLRDVIKIPATADNAAIEAAAKASEKVKLFIDGKTIKKVIIVPEKLVNIAVG